MYPDELRITFLGTSTALPDEGSDTASYAIGGRVLVDTGWFAIDNLRRANIDPLSIDLLLFTHFHHDHYLSLPSVLFYRLMKRRALDELTIAGPAEDIERVVALALDFLQVDRFFPHAGKPTLMPLRPGDAFEAHGLRIRTHGTVHPVAGVSYRFEEPETGAALVLTGDTAFHPPLADFAKGCHMLVHEASLGPIEADPANNPALHSGAIDAAKLAKLAGADKLILVHGPIAKAEACVQAAQEVFGPDVAWPKDGETIALTLDHPRKA